MRDALLRLYCVLWAILNDCAATTIAADLVACVRKASQVQQIHDLTFKLPRGGDDLCDYRDENPIPMFLHIAVAVRLS